MPIAEQLNQKVEAALSGFLSGERPTSRATVADCLLATAIALLDAYTAPGSGPISSELGHLVDALFNREDETVRGLDAPTYETLRTALHQLRKVRNANEVEKGREG